MTCAGRHAQHGRTSQVARPDPREVPSTSPLKGSDLVLQPRPTVRLARLVRVVSASASSGVETPKVRAARPLGRPARIAKLFAACSIAALVAASCGTTTPTVRSATRNQSSTTTTLSFALNTWGTTWSYNEFNPTFLSVASGTAVLPLAFQTGPALGAFSPQIAKSWSAHGNTLTVHLRPNLRWQDGHRLTSTDVYDSIVLYGTEDIVWPDILNVATPSTTTVTFTLQPGVPALQAEQAILSTRPVPSFIYGQFVTPQLKAAEVASEQLQVSNKELLERKYGAAAQQKIAAGDQLLSAAQKAKETSATNLLSAAFKRLQAFQPRTLVGDGPFKLVHVNVNQAHFIKWTGFYLANNIHLAGIEFLGLANNQAIWGAVLGGHTDIPSVFIPGNILTKILQVPDMHVRVAPFSGAVLLFNDRQPPLNEAAVRRALSYVIPRAKVNKAAAGGSKDAGQIPVSPPDGMLADMQHTWLSAAERSHLDAYPVSLSRAARLLTSKGFRKKGGEWRLPDGHRFTLTLKTVAAYSNAVESDDVAAAALTNFGIKTVVEGLTAAALGPTVEKGDFQLADYGMTGSRDPLSQFDYILGRTTNFPLSGTYAGEPGIGFGPRADVPGLGSVSVPDALDQEAASVPSGSRMRALVWDWARFVNQEVPYLVYAQTDVQWTYSSARITDWPPHSSQLWTTLSMNDPGGIVAMLERGYLRPKA